MSEPQAPVPAQIIDKGLPTAGLLAQVLVAKYADHQPLYRQEAIFERAGLALRERPGRADDLGRGLSRGGESHLVWSLPARADAT